MEDKDLLNGYCDFVNDKTSPCSSNHVDYINRLNELNSLGCDICRLDTASVGMSAEAGEFSEIVKKIKFQGKPWNDDNIYHLKRELGDVIFYWTEACLSLGVTPAEIIGMNRDKLEARFPDGAFKSEHSETRKEGDI